jgi:hypothetical protein
MAKFISEQEMQQLEKQGFAKTPQATPVMKFISDDDMAKLETSVPQSETAVRNLAQGFTLGFSDELAGAGEAVGKMIGVDGLGGPMRDIRMSESGPTLELDKLKQAYQAGRDAERSALKLDMQENPGTALVSNIAGGAALPVGQLAALKNLSLAKQGAVVGAAAGAGMSEADSVGGVVTDAAVGGLGGAVVGKTIDATGKIIGKGFEAGKQGAINLKQKISGTQSQSASAQSQAAAKASASIEGGAIQSEMSGEMFKVKAPQSLDELNAWQPKADAGAMPGKERLREVVATVQDLETHPLKYHFDMMENPKAMKELKLQFENLPTKSAKKIAEYNMQIVKESEQKIGETVRGLSGGKDPKSLTDAGYDFISSVKDKYNAEKDALGPVFQTIRQRAGVVSPNEAGDLIQAIGQNSKVGKLLKQDVETGRMTLGANTPRSGISDQEHSILKRVIDDLNDGMSFEEIQAAREFMRKAIDPSNPGASSEIVQVRSLLLGQLEDLAAKNGPDVGETFKAYAMNERKRESIEKIIGGKIESLDAMFAANPDKAVQKIFANPNYSKIVGEYVGPEKMQELSAAYIQQGLNKATDSAKGFAPHTFKSWLKSNEQFLKANVSPEVQERLSALADYGYFGRRFLDEVNPSGTAASLLKGLEAGKFKTVMKQDGIKAAIMNEVASRAQSAVNQKQAIKSVNRALSSEPVPAPQQRFSVPKMLKEINLDGSATTRGGSSGASSKVIPLVQEMRPVATKEEKKEEKQPAMKPLKGEEKWADDGFKKLLEHTKDPQARAILEQNKGALLKSKKAKDLLMQASDLKPNSKAMEVVLSALKLHAAAPKDKI